MTVVFENLAVSSLINTAALLLLLSMLSRNVILSSGRIRAYRIAIWATILVMLTEVATTALDLGGPACRIPNILCNLIGFSCSAFLPYLLAMAYDEELLKWKKAVFLPPALLTLLCVLSGKTGWVFSVSPENRYDRGPLFWVYVAVFLLGLILLLLANRREAGRFYREEKIYLTVLFILFLAGISIQILHPEIHSSWLCVTLSLLLYYVFQRELQFKFDLLTGILNRPAFEKDLHNPPRGCNLLMVFDLDSFKEINDTQGHLAGDQSLRVSAEILRKSFQRIGRCYRIGGDEFTVLGRGREETVQRAIRQMLSETERQRDKTSATIPSISYGYSYHRAGEPFSQTFLRADREMYQYKKQRIEHPRHQPLKQEI